MHPLVGIARLAYSAPTLTEKRAASYFELPSFRLLNRCPNPRMPFEWTINPYRGCEFGCKYCYARYTHEFMELRDPDDFERLIYAKRWNPAYLRAEMRRIDPREAIAIGTATDPYQPAERRFRVTRSILEVLAGFRGRKLWITTKSDLVVRDLDLLRRIGAANLISVNLTITTMDEALARKLEPRAPRPALRVAALRRLRDAGIDAGVMCAPVLPWINDREAQLEAVARAADGAGAVWLVGGPVFLKPCSKAVFLPFIEREFPQLAARYARLFERSAFLKGDYPRLVQERLSRVRDRCGLRRRQDRELPPGWGIEEQMNLPLPELKVNAERGSCVSSELGSGESFLRKPFGVAGV